MGLGQVSFKVMRKQQQDAGFGTMSVSLGSLGLLFSPMKVNVPLS